MNNDYLNSSDDQQGGDWLSGGLDTPPPPTAPEVPVPQAGGDPYASSTGDGWLDAPAAAPAPAPEMGSWMDATPVEAATPATQQHQGSMLDPYASSAGISASAPMGHPGDLMVERPTLDQVQPGIRTVGSPLGGEISDLVLDVEVPVEVCFGDAALTVEDFLELGSGSVVELDHSIDLPVDLRVRGRVVARGQLVTINGNYGLRITELTERR